VGQLGQTRTHRQRPGAGVETHFQLALAFAEVCRQQAGGDAHFSAMPKKGPSKPASGQC
jgi:hypothetical protein